MDRRTLASQSMLYDPENSLTEEQLRRELDFLNEQLEKMGLSEDYLSKSGRSYRDSGLGTGERRTPRSRQTNSPEFDFEDSLPTPKFESVVRPKTSVRFSTPARRSDERKADSRDRVVRDIEYEDQDFDKYVTRRRRRSPARTILTILTISVMSEGTSRLSIRQHMMASLHGLITSRILKLVRLLTAGLQLRRDCIWQSRSETRHKASWEICRRGRRKSIAGLYRPLKRGLRLQIKLSYTGLSCVRDIRRPLKRSRSWARISSGSRILHIRQLHTMCKKHWPRSNSLTR